MDLVPTVNSSCTDKTSVKVSDKDSTDEVTALQMREMINPKGAVHHVIT